ncbi:hypothetical protein FQR65_LT11924 [Abscondita terminalis]|nr:hypothetical protein FQR65_LT11924 [Abscondita terminalis]
MDEFSVRNLLKSIIEEKDVVIKELRDKIILLEDKINMISKINKITVQNYDKMQFNSSNTINENTNQNEGQSKVQQHTQMLNVETKKKLRSKSTSSISLNLNDETNDTTVNKYTDKETVVFKEMSNKENEWIKIERKKSKSFKSKYIRLPIGSCDDIYMYTAYQ